MNLETITGGARALLGDDEERIMREAEVYAVTGKSRTQRWRDERAGRFPKRVSLGPNSVGWLRSEIRAWLAARAAERRCA